MHNIFYAIHKGKKMLNITLPIAWLCFITYFCNIKFKENS